MGHLSGLRTAIRPALYRETSVDLLEQVPDAESAEASMSAPHFVLVNAVSGEVLHQGPLTACLRWKALFAIVSARLGYGFTPRIDPA